MKGFLTRHDRIFKKTHDLDELAAACEAVDPKLAPTLGPARDLTIFAWQFRYPGETELPPTDEVTSLLQIAHAAYDALLTRLPGEVRP